MTRESENWTSESWKKGEKKMAKKPVEQLERELNAAEEAADKARKDLEKEKQEAFDRKVRAAKVTAKNAKKSHIVRSAEYARQMVSKKADLELLKLDFEDVVSEEADVAVRKNQPAKDRVIAPIAPQDPPKKEQEAVPVAQSKSAANRLWVWLTEKKA